VGDPGKIEKQSQSQMLVLDRFTWRRNQLTWIKVFVSILTLTNRTGLSDP